MEQRLPFDGLIVETARDAIAAISDERSAALAKSRDRVEVRDGHRVGAAGPDALWSFEVDTELAPFPDTPGRLRVAPGDPLPVRVVAVGDMSIVLAMSDGLDELGPDDVVERAELALEHDFVYARLAERLDHLTAEGEPHGSLAEALLLTDRGDLLEAETNDEPSDGGPTDVDTVQASAATRAILPGVRFTWGPPGTGKTKVLALAVAEAVERGHRVLVLAHANVAVDVAMARVATEFTSRADDPSIRGAQARIRAGVATLAPKADELPLADLSVADMRRSDSAQAALLRGEVLRVGVSTALLAPHPEVLPSHVLSDRHPDLVGRMAQLEVERRTISDRMRVEDEPDRAASTQHLLVVGRELRRLRGELSAAEDALIVQARVIGTTLSKAVLDDAVWDWPADVVIVDEASMAALPFALALAMRGTGSLSFFGDFRQLPPIAMAETELARRWFARDVFEFAGVVESHERGEADTRVSVLRTQFRMGEQICETINALAYDGLLSTHASARKTAIRLAELPPIAGTEVVIVDLAGLGAVCSLPRQADSWSRFNLLSAAVVATLTDDALRAGSHDIGIVSPYRAQVRLLSAAVRHRPGVSASTIHRFQGSERDVILFDLTDGYPQTGPSRLTGKDPDLARRLLNVGCSRARGKLILVVDTEFAEERLPPASILRTLIRVAEEAGAERVSADTVIRTRSIETSRANLPAQKHSISWIADWEGAQAEVHLAVGEGSDVEVNLGPGSADDDWMRSLLAASHDPRRLAVHGDYAAIRSLDGSGARAMLRPAGDAPWAAIGRNRMLVGPRSGRGPAADWTNESLITAVLDLLTTEA